MRQDTDWKIVNLLWSFIIFLCGVTVCHLLITWGSLGVIAETNSRLAALEQHCGYAPDKDTE